MKTLLIFFLALSCGYSLAEIRPVVLLIDPGHGGKDPGHLPASDTLKQEKDLALEISLKVGQYFEHNTSNITIVYTRTDDVYPTLDDRVNQANNLGVDYMLSIHINGNPNTEISGSETLIHNFDASKSHSWAKLIQGELKKNTGRKSRGVKTSQDLGHSLQILKYTKMPAIIVECGFITNEDECAYLHSILGQETIASSIFLATKSFIASQHPDRNFDLPLELPEPLLADQPHYKVQIMASIDPVNTDIPEFTKLDRPVERKHVDGTSIFKYKYFVGPFADKKQAKDAQKEVQSKGFEDAFLVYFD